MSPKARVKVRAYKGNPVVVVQSSGVHVSSTGTMAAVNAVDRPLVAALLAYGVNDGELAELLAALGEDRSTNDGSLPTLPSPAVSAWIQRVSMRLAGFSNLAGATAVGNVISTLVFRHYGIGAA